MSYEHIDLFTGSLIAGFPIAMFDCWRVSMVDVRRPYHVYTVSECICTRWSLASRLLIEGTIKWNPVISEPYSSESPPVTSRLRKQALLVQKEAGYLYYPGKTYIYIHSTYFNIIQMIAVQLKYVQWTPRSSPINSLSFWAQAQPCLQNLLHIFGVQMGTAVSFLILSRGNNGSVLLGGTKPFLVKKTGSKFKDHVGECHQNEGFDRVWMDLNDMRRHREMEPGLIWI